MPKSSGKGRTEAQCILQVVGGQMSVAHGHRQSRTSHAALQQNEVIAVLDEEWCIARCLPLVAEARPGQGAAVRCNDRVRRTMLVPLTLTKEFP